MSLIKFAKAIGGREQTVRFGLRQRPGGNPRLVESLDFGVQVICFCMIVFELVQLREEAFKAVPVAAAADKVKAGKDLLTAKVDAVKAEINQRTAYVKLMSLIGKQ